jgi:glycosyltransferase involved in cell wall biosynthesis
MLRALHVANGRLFGGIERMLVTLSEPASAGFGLVHEFAICAPGRLVDALRTSGAAPRLLGDVRLSAPASVWKARMALRETIERTAPDVLICHAPWSFALFASVGRRYQLPVVWWQHDRATGEPLIERWARATPADLVISNSRWTARSAQTIHPEAPVVVVHCPVTVPAAPSSSDRIALRRLLGADGSDVVILSASRLEAWKGHLQMLRALARLANGPCWTLWLAGAAQRPHEVAYRTDLEREVVRLGLERRVQFLGERTDVPALMSAADLFCQANERPEPFGIVFAEALLSGLPVITAAMGGATEVVDETCAGLYDPMDTSGLTTTLRRLLADAHLRARLGAAGPAHARARCAPGMVLPILEQVLSECRSRAAA